MSNTEESAFYSESAIKAQFEKYLDEALENVEITRHEREWCQKADLPEGSERHSGRSPIFVSEVMMDCPGQEPMPLRGMCVMTLEQSETTPHLLFTLSSGVIRFDSWLRLIDYIDNSLVDQPSELMHFVPLQLRHFVRNIFNGSFSKRLISGNVFLRLCVHYELGLEADGRWLLSTLEGLPSIRTVARDQLQQDMTQQFETYKKTHENCSVGHDLHQVLSSNPEVDYVLAHYCNPAPNETWDIELIYSAACGAVEASDIEQDKLEVVDWLKNSSNSLGGNFTVAIKEYWKREEGDGFTLGAYIEHSLRGRFIDQLMQARHQGDVSNSEFIDFYNFAIGVNNGDMQSTIVKIGKQPGSQFIVAGWYCIHLGDPSEKVCVMTNTGLNFFANRQAVFEYLKQRLTLNTLKHAASDTTVSSHAPLSRYLSHQDRVALNSEEEPTIYLLKQTDNLYEALQQNLLDKVLSDNKYLCHWYLEHFPRPVAFTPPDSASHVHAFMDDALDIRRIINPELVQLSGSQRWNSEVSIVSTQIDAGEYFLIRERVSGEGIKENLNLLNQRTNELLDNLPTLRAAAYHQLKEAWRQQEETDLDLTYVSVEIAGSGPTASISRSLIDTLLEHVSQYHPLPTDYRDISFTASTDAQRPRLKINEAESKRLHSIVIEVGKQFLEQTLRYFQRFLSDESSSQTQLNRQLMAVIKANVLWADGYYYFRYSKQLSLHDAGCINVLSAHRQREKRLSYYYFVPEVYAVSLSSKDLNLNVPLANCFVITEHGGLRSDCAGHAILWTPSRRFEAFQTLEACQEALQERLTHPTAYLELFTCMLRAHRASVEGQRHLLADDSTLLFEFERLTGDFLMELASDALDQQLLEIEESLEKAIEARLPSEVFQASVENYLERLRAGFNLEGFAWEVEAAVFKQHLPQALKNASIQEQYEYALIMDRYHAAFQNEQDYLYGIPNLANFTLNALNTAFKRDFPLVSLNAENVLITFVGPSSIAMITPGEQAKPETKFSLTEYVLNGLNLPSGKIELSSLNSIPLPETLNEKYIKALIHTLDVHTTYKKILHNTLAPEQPEYKKRFTLYSQQLPVQTLEIAFMNKLSSVLSDTGFRYVEHILNFPDGMARPHYNGTTLTIRPLQLCVSSTATPDAVKGMYLLGPLTSTHGPLVLWVTYGSSLTFKEFANESSLITALTTNESLQTDVIKRVSIDARSKYENGGFNNPHATFITRFMPILDIIPEGPVSLSHTQILENFLPRLYRENLNFLLDMATAPSGKVDQTDSEFFNQLLSLGISTLTPTYFPAKLGIPVLVVQTVGLLKASLDAGNKSHWGEAITEFVVALGLIILQVFSRAPKRLGEKRQTPVTLSPLYDLEEHSAPVQRLSGYRAEQMAALDAYIDHTVSLTDLNFEASTNIYRHKNLPNHYIAMSGKVYAVTLSGNRWRLVIGEGREGPAIKLNSINRWELDLYEPLVGGGPTLSVFKREPIGHTSFPIEIIGMPLMHALRPDKATAIVVAHEAAVSYLTEANRVLKTFMQDPHLQTPLAQWLKAHLGVPVLLETYTNKIASAITAILGRLLKRSMNPLTSPRYISGKTPKHPNTRVAFVNPRDTIKYIYLEDNFFRPPISPYGPRPLAGLKKTIPAFNVDTHWRAITLIHEISHQMFNTEDIAYLNSSYPYPELFDPRIQTGLFYRTTLGKFQNSGLSNSTLRNDLFRQIDQTAHALILKETGSQTLDQARDAFLSNPDQRVTIILSNADSLTLIISRLGGKIDQYVPVSP
ncbi:DUF6543 domain-containing protein [Pseudomonas sp. SIMBA_077]